MGGCVALYIQLGWCLPQIQTRYSFCFLHARKLHLFQQRYCFFAPPKDVIIGKSFEDNYALSDERQKINEHGGPIWRKKTGSVWRLAERKDSSTFEPAQQDMEAFARCIFPMVRTYFESEEGKREFAEWKRNKELGLFPKNDEF